MYSWFRKARWTRHQIANIGWITEKAKEFQGGGLGLGGGGIYFCFTNYAKVFDCVFQLLSCVQLFVTPWTAAHLASLSFTISQLLKLLSIELVLQSNHLILCHPLLLLPSILPSIRVFCNESLFASGGHRIGASVSASVLPMNIQHSLCGSQQTVENS